VKESRAVLYETITRRGISNPDIKKSFDLSMTSSRNQCAQDADGPKKARNFGKKGRN
jgi:hypothetical protein